MRFSSLAAVMLGLAVFGQAAIPVPAAASGRNHHRREHHAAAHHRSFGRHSATTRAARAYQATPYAAGADDGKPDCRYPDGTPFDPDIIGGPNHVGAGGPAVNLGGFAPCGY